jgi:hypothetical protein
MAQRPNTIPFIAPGAGGAQPSSAAAAAKQTGYLPSASQAPVPSSAATQSIPNKTSSRPPAVKAKGLPRGNQSKREQRQQKAERKARLTDDDFPADPGIEPVTSCPGIMVLCGLTVEGYVWTYKPSWSDFVESFVELFYRAERTLQRF